MASVSRGVLVGVIALAAVGCTPKSRMVAMRTGQGDAMPVIRVAPGYVERIALMDRYRLHDEDRKHMMAKPHVWVEEVSEDETPVTGDTTGADGSKESDAAPVVTH